MGSSDLCAECGGNLVLSPPRFVGDSREYVCSKCGVVAPFPEELYPPSEEKYGRGIQSFGVLGNNLGSMLSMRNANGLSDLYALRGDNGRYKPVVTSLMPGHLTGIEESNKDLLTFKTTVVGDLERAQSRKGRSVIGNQGTAISNSLRTWLKEIKRLTGDNEPVCMKRNGVSKQKEVMVIKGDFNGEYLEAFRRA